MLFNSLTFLIFALVFFGIFPLLKKTGRNIRWFFLVVASFVFYGWWDWRFLFLIIGSGLIDFYAGLAITRFPGKKTIFLILSLFGNIGSLIAFKYMGFIAENLERVLFHLGIQADLGHGIPEFMLILPVGISFYTFQSMSYTIDVYRGRINPTRNILHFFAYLSMFPQLVAGPIIRAKSLLPQLEKIRKTTEAEKWNGFKLITIGFFKKVVMADNLAPLVNTAFSDIAPPHSSFYWWLVISAFAFQIYFDFSGYSDIARGLAKWMGFHFRINFNHPYISTSIREFWTRWHLSLSTWFRDYVYIPLGGSRKGKFRGHLNIWITMTVSGLWHGAAWNFVIWGALHAFWLSIERITKWDKCLKSIKAGKYLALIIIIVQVWIAWVFFRASGFGQAFDIVRNMLCFNFLTDYTPDNIYINGIVYLVLGIIIELFFLFGIRRRKLYRSKNYCYFEIFYIALLIFSCVFLRGKGLEFIYFQF